MMLYPLYEKVMLKVFCCPACENLYIEGEGHAGCAVRHAPGDCCHLRDVRLSDEEWNKINDVAQAVRKRNER